MTFADDQYATGEMPAPAMVIEAACPMPGSRQASIGEGKPHGYLGSPLGVCPLDARRGFGLHGTRSGTTILNGTPLRSKGQSSYI